MKHELRNSINKKRESNIQKAIRIQIKNLSSIPPLLPPYAAYRTASYYVDIQNSSPRLHVTKANGKWTKNMNKELSNSFFLFSFFFFTFPT